MNTKDDVLIFIPTLNEADSIGDLITDFRELGYTNILVVDGNSSDATREIAEKCGAKVIVQHGKGKGMAVRDAFAIADAEILVMIDGDGTYVPADVEKLLEPVREGIADHVIGTRLEMYEKGAFTRLNHFGNRLLNKIFGMLYGEWLTDILSGYRVFKKSAYKAFDLNEEGFGIETEITAESVKKDLRIVEIPILYKMRSGRTKLNPIRDGVRIAFTIYKLVKTYNPLFYFGVIGILFFTIGCISGAYVLWEWLKTPRVEHIPLTIFTALMIITGVQVIIFGMLSDIIVLLQKEVMRAIKDGKKEL
ncbi:MAG: glycosyl transferase family 2 [Candidatus Syntrophoarchaeum caldarius]|uniref:Glycosyl transferase family 2 n=1 Tax=Candidatus Syntropharchaeum caldarium TaxID=1838285 RepID=A0A1F2PBN6_9EURY|nr:MAG: glycosyl transferase family 2 [Candidatus Syntrophoarchaeum caldarius]